MVPAVPVWYTIYLLYVCCPTVHVPSFRLSKWPAHFHFAVSLWMTPMTRVFDLARLFLFQSRDGIVPTSTLKQFSRSRQAVLLPQPVSTTQTWKSNDHYIMWHKLMSQKKKTMGDSDLNPRPTVYKSSARPLGINFRPGLGEKLYIVNLYWV